VRDARRLEDPHQLELRRRAGLEVVEEPLAGAEDDRGNLKIDLVYEAGGQGLLSA